MCLITAICFAQTAQAQDTWKGLRLADSVTLERTLCFGTCPAYRLNITRLGVITFESRNPGESIQVTDSIPAREFISILGSALYTNFTELPDRIADDSRFCPMKATDHETVTVTIYIPGRIKRVEDYHGCTWAPSGLRDLEIYIDKVANSSRWIRPAKIR